ncbi:MAG: hypothetical protein ACO35B_06440 [Luminiphilus sp.]
MTNTPTHFEDILDQAYSSARAAVKGFLDDYRAKRPDCPNCEPAACGFAWVEIAGTTAFARYCRKWEKMDVPGSGRYGQKHWSKGRYFWKPGFDSGQSIEVAEVGAQAFASVLMDHGIEAHACSRFD